VIKDEYQLNQQHEDDDDSSHPPMITLDNTSSNTMIVPYNNSSNSNNNNSKEEQHPNHEYHHHVHDKEQEEIRTIQRNPKFLLYYTHSGFSNQLLSIERAAKFAFATKRILVLPPILPHHTSSSTNTVDDDDDDDDKFSSFTPRAAGSKCHVSLHYEEFVNKYIPQDIEKAKNLKIAFPSFKEIFDFDDFTTKTGIQFMDMREFVIQYPNYSTNRNFKNDTLWCKGPLEEMKIKFVRNCGMDSTFDELVPFFNQHCGGDHDDRNDAVVAVLGSAFVMPQPLPNSTYFDHHIQNVFSKYFGLKLGDKFMTLLKSLYEQFTAVVDHGDYSAVHVRFQDGMKIPSCNTTRVRNLYLELFARLKERNVTHGSHVLVADSNPAAFDCFQYHAAAAAAGSDVVYRGFRIKDYIILDNGNHNNPNHSKIKEMFNNINVQKDTLYLLLDQIMVGLGKEVVFSFHGTTMRSSTFQGQIMRWHENRKSILAAMEAMDVLKKDVQARRINTS
jgi:hypothetical protein